MLVGMALCSATEPTLDRTRDVERGDVDLDVDALSALARHGEVIGQRYTLEHVIGIGGMGVIYGAVQESLDRRVAIKVPRPELARDTAACDRLRAEAYAGSRINHRNVVRMIDYGEHAGVPYLVMDHIVGPRLSTLCRARGQLAPAEAANLVLQILAGLEATHAAGVIHADVKADNVLVATLADGTYQLHLIDFGLATIATDFHPIDHSLTNQISGTPEYLAPEIVRGERPSVASDLYAIGIIFYELVAGETPFVAETNSLILSQQVGADPIPMASHCCDSTIPVVYEKLVRRALAKDPGHRFDSAAAFRAALDQVLAAPIAKPRAKTETGPEAFSSDDVTPLLDVGDALPEARRDGRGKLRVAAARLALQRHAVTAAVANDDPDRIVIAYLELARAHVDQHQIGGAIKELEDGLELLTCRRGASCRSVWRLQLTLAALYDGSGDRAMAYRVNYEARLQAARAGSLLGIERVDAFAQRLGRRPRRTSNS